MSLGIYISVPFCRTKCSYCNFASDVFSRAVFERYVDRVCADIASAPQIAQEMGGQIEKEVDSIYLGGGTPTVLEAGQLQRIFAAVRAQFEVRSDAEVTVECAPGTLTSSVIEGLLSCGVNRVSLGVQSFVDQEAAAVGRLHKRATVLRTLPPACRGDYEYQHRSDRRTAAPDRRKLAGVRRRNCWRQAPLTQASTCSKWTKIRDWAAN